MAAYPADGGDPGTWGASLEAFEDVTRDRTTGKILDGAEQQTSAAPTTDAALANKKYVDDNHPVKTWVRFDATGAIIGTGENITSVTLNGTGRYDILWDANFNNGNYSAVATIDRIASSAIAFATVANIVAGGCTVYTFGSSQAAANLACSVIAAGV